MKIGDRVFVKGIVDEIRKDVVIIKNDGGYFGTVPSEIIDNAEPTTLGKIKAEIQQIEPYDLPWDKRTPEHIRDMALEIVEKYAEQEPTDKSNLEKICEELAAENDDLRDQLAMRDRFKQEPCDDAVSRQAVINLVRGRNSALEEPRIFNSHNSGVVFEHYINDLPPVRPKEPTGHWIDTDRDDACWCMCSE